MRRTILIRVAEHLHTASHRNSRHLAAARAAPASATGLLEGGGAAAAAQRRHGGGGRRGHGRSLARTRDGRRESFRTRTGHRGLLRRSAGRAGRRGLVVAGEFGTPPRPRAPSSPRPSRQNGPSASPARRASSPTAPPSSPATRSRPSACRTRCRSGSHDAASPASQGELPPWTFSCRCVDPGAVECGGRRAALTGTRSGSYSRVSARERFPSFMAPASHRTFLQGVRSRGRARLPRESRKAQGRSRRA